MKWRPRGVRWHVPPCGHLLLMLYFTACSGGETLPRATDSDFRRIQAYEARVAEGSSRAADTQLDCQPRCEAAQLTCAAARDLCDLAGRRDDADARRRCTDARRACSGTRTTVEECECR